MEQAIPLSAHHPVYKDSQYYNGSKYHANIGWLEGELSREGRETNISLRWRTGDGDRQPFGHPLDVPFDVESGV